MKKTIYINPRYKAIVYDEDKNFATPLSINAHHIDWFYVVPFDCEIRYKDRSTGKIIVKQAEKNDILIQFFDRPEIKNICVLIKNKEWKENIISLMAEQAKGQTILENSCPCCGDCEMCSCN